MQFGYCFLLLLDCIKLEEASQGSGKAPPPSSSYSLLPNIPMCSAGEVWGRLGPPVPISSSPPKLESGKGLPCRILSFQGRAVTLSKNLGGTYEIIIKQDWEPCNLTAFWLWRGSLQEVSDDTIKKMVRHFGIKPIAWNEKRVGLTSNLQLG